VQAEALDELKLGIRFGAGSAGTGLSVTPRTTVEVHARTQTIGGDGVHFGKGDLAIVE